METLEAKGEKSELAELIQKAEVGFTETEALTALKEMEPVLDGKEKPIEDPVKIINHIGPVAFWKAMNHPPKNLTPKPEDIKFPMEDFYALQRAISGYKPR